jgi:hypothetical protein
MLASEKLVSRSEISLVIAVCGALFFLTFTNGDDPLWSAPAMTLFFASGTAFLYALVPSAEGLLARMLAGLGVVPASAQCRLFGPERQIRIIGPLSGGARERNAPEATLPTIHFGLGAVRMIGLVRLVPRFSLGGVELK